MVSRKLVTALIVAGVLFSATGAAATGVCIGDPRLCDGGGGGGGGGGSTSPFAKIVLDISNGDDDFPGGQEARTSGEGSSEQPGQQQGNGVSEGETCIFTIHRSGPTGKSASVEWKTRDGTAVGSDGKSPGDYVRNEGTSFFKPGQRDAFVFIETRFDFETEPDEHFFVILKNPSKAVIDDKKGKCTIFANFGKG